MEFHERFDEENDIKVGNLVGYEKKDGTGDVVGILTVKLQHQGARHCVANKAVYIDISNKKYEKIDYDVSFANFQNLTPEFVQDLAEKLPKEYKNILQITKTTTISAPGIEDIIIKDGNNQ